MKLFRALAFVLIVGSMVMSAFGAQPATQPAARVAIRVNAGLEEDWKDANGNVWKADNGSESGSTMDRDTLEVAGAKGLERIYQTERYSMDSYTFKVENGKWLVKLHFSEGYDGIQDETGRVFTYEVKDGAADKGKSAKKVEHFSPWKASGGFGKAYVDSIPVEVTAGSISIVFTPEAENTQINAIEIIPQ